MMYRYEPWAPSPARRGGLGRGKACAGVREFFPRQLYPLPACPAIGRSPQAFVDTRANGSQTCLLTPCIQGEEYTS